MQDSSSQPVVHRISWSLGILLKNLWNTTEKEKPIVRRLQLAAEMQPSPLESFRHLQFKKRLQVTCLGAFIQDDFFLPIMLDLILDISSGGKRLKPLIFFPRGFPELPWVLSHRLLLPSFIFSEPFFSSSFNLEQNLKAQNSSASKLFFSLDGYMIMNSTFLSLHVDLLSMTSKTGSLQNGKG